MLRLIVLCLLLASCSLPLKPEDPECDNGGGAEVYCPGDGVCFTNFNFC